MSVCSHVCVCVLTCVISRLRTYSVGSDPAMVDFIFEVGQSEKLQNENQACFEFDDENKKINASAEPTD